MKSDRLPDSVGADWITLRLQANVEIVYLGDGSIVIKPPRGGRSGTLGRPHLRRELQRALPTIGAFDAFCLDYFPSVKLLFSNGMDRNERTNLLLESVDCMEIHERLQDHIKDRVTFAKESQCSL